MPEDHVTRRGRPDRECARSNDYIIVARQNTRSARPEPNDDIIDSGRACYERTTPEDRVPRSCQSDSSSRTYNHVIVFSRQGDTRTRPDHNGIRTRRKGGASGTPNDNEAGPCCDPRAESGKTDHDGFPDSRCVVRCTVADEDNVVSRCHCGTRLIPKHTA